MAYTYTIGGENVSANGVKLTGGGETRTLVDTRSIHADIIAGNIKIRIDPNTPSDMSDDTEIGESRPITATEMAGAVTISYNSETNKVSAYVNGISAVSKAPEDIGIEVGGSSALEDVTFISDGVRRAVSRSGASEAHAGGYLDITIPADSNGSGGYLVRQALLILCTKQYMDGTGIANGGSEFIYVQLIRNATTGTIEYAIASGIGTTPNVYSLSNSNVIKNGDVITLAGTIKTVFWGSNSNASVNASNGNEYAVYKVSKDFVAANPLKA